MSSEDEAAREYFGQGSPTGTETRAPTPESPRDDEPLASPAQKNARAKKQVPVPTRTLRPRKATQDTSPQPVEASSPPKPKKGRPAAPAAAKKSPAKGKQKRKTKALWSEDEDDDDIDYEAGVHASPLAGAAARRGRQTVDPFDDEPAFGPWPIRNAPAQKSKQVHFAPRAHVRVIAPRPRRQPSPTPLPIDPPRNRRFSLPRRAPDEETDGMVVELDEDGWQRMPQSPMRPGVKRTLEPASPPHARAKKAKDDDDIGPVDTSHFKKGRIAKSNTVVIPAAARVIIASGFKIYMPLHVWSDEVLEAERKSRVVVLNGTKPPDTLNVTIHEEEMSLENYQTWTKRCSKALRHINFDPLVVEMLEAHFDRCALGPQKRANWETWRDYDLEVRWQMQGEEPLDISIFHLDYWSAALADDHDRRTQRISARPQQSQQVAPQPGPSRQLSRSSRGQSRSSYARCIVCGSKSHVYKKDSWTTDTCKPVWLEWNPEKRLLLCRRTAAIFCWSYNSDNGCHRDDCRYKQRGHVCSLCGGTDHCAQRCTAVA